MTGPIVAVLAALMTAASAISGADHSELIAEAEQIKLEEEKKEEASKYLIAIDAGHQEKGNFGEEPVGPGAAETKTKVAGGTRGTTTGVPEYELTLDLSLKLEEELEERGYSVLMIRETNDVDITNAERAQIANEADADVFIRVHANGSDSASANGAMTICQTSSNPYNGELYEDSKRLSELVLDAYTEATGIRKEYVWETDSMTGINWCEVPVTIIELGYMTNPEEDLKMQEEDFQLLMAQGMADGIEAYLEEKKEAEETAESGIEGEEEILSEDEESSESGSEGEEHIPSESGEPSEGESEEEAEESEETSISEDEEKERQIEAERQEKEERAKEEKAQALRDALASTIFSPARKAERSAQNAAGLIADVGKKIINRYEKEVYEAKDAQMKELEEELLAEIAGYGGKWSLYLKRLDTGHVIGINEDEKMVAASLIKLFIAGEFYALGEMGELDVDAYSDLPDRMISVSDNSAANSLISACTMEKINEFVEEKGYEETELNRRMMDWGETENYTSARDCGRMLEEVLLGEYVSAEASERILEDLKNQQKTFKIPAGVPEEVETGNKTGELDGVDNDAAIVWSPACTYILCIMSSDTGGRIDRIKNLSSMVYQSINPEQE